MLAEKSSRVYVIHRRTVFRGEDKLVEMLSALPNVEFVLESKITALHGEGTLTGVTVENAAGEKRSFGLMACLSPWAGACEWGLCRLYGA